MESTTSYTTPSGGTKTHHVVFATNALPCTFSGTKRPKTPIVIFASSKANNYSDAKNAHSITVFKRRKLAVTNLTRCTEFCFNEEWQKIVRPGMEEAAFGIEIADEGELNAPALLRADRIRVGKNAVLNAPLLKSVSTLELHPECTVNAPNLKKVIFFSSALQPEPSAPETARTSPIMLPALEKISESLRLCKNTKLTLPALEHFSGDLHIECGAELHTPALKQREGPYNIEDGAIFNAPKLPIFIAGTSNTLRKFPFLKKYFGFSPENNDKHPNQ